MAVASFAEKLFHLEYGRDLLQQVQDLWMELAVKLEIPPWSDVWTAGHDATVDLLHAGQSLSYFVFLIGQPVVRLLAWVSYWVAIWLYQTVLVDGLYHHGGAQVKEFAVWYWNWQSNLSREELLYEAVVIIWLIALYQLYRFLKRRQYHRRIMIWIDRKQRQTYKAYNDGVRRIARVSLVLAAMTSHVLFLSGAAALRLLIPQLATLLANPKVISIISLWIPLFWTITTIFQYKEAQSEPHHNSNRAPPSRRRFSLGRGITNDNDWKTPQRRTGRRRSTGRSPVAAAPSQSALLEHELRDWLQFWMVRGALEALKRCVGWLTPSWLISTTFELEFLFYVWIYALPLIQPETMAGLQLPEGRPLRVLCSVLGPYAQQVVDQVSGIIPEAFWHNQVVGLSSQVVRFLTMVRMLKPATADSIVHWMEEGRRLFVPALTLFSPLTKYGVVYVQFLLPLAKSHYNESSTMVLWLQYWVVNAGVDFGLTLVPSIVWWIPLSTQVMFGLWCYLTLPQTIQDWYGSLEYELKCFKLLPGDHQDEAWEATRTARFLLWVWEILPKAQDDENVGSSDAAGAATSANPENHPVVVETRTVESTTTTARVVVEANTTGRTAEDDGEEESEDKLSPLPKEREEEEDDSPRSRRDRDSSTSPKMLVSVDTCTTTTTEEGDDDEYDPQSETELAQDDGVLRNHDASSSDTDSDVAVVDFDFQQDRHGNDDDKSFSFSQQPERAPMHPMMTRSARRRAEQQRRPHRPREVIRD